MSEINLAQSFEWFEESMKKAVSRAKEIGHLEKKNTWFQIATHLEKLRQNGGTMYRQKALTRQQVINMLDDRVTKNIEQEAAQSVN